MGLVTELRASRLVRLAAPLRCSFCGRSEAAVGKLARGASAFICDGCVGACARVMDESGPRPQGAGPRGG